MTGKDIKKIMIDLDTNQKGLAARLGITERTLNKLCNRDKIPTVYRLAIERLERNIDCDYYGVNQLNKIIELFIYYVQDIDDPLSKEYLKTAISSHIHGQLKEVPREFINKTIDLIYLSDHI